MYDASDDRDEPEEPKKELTMWEKHQLRLDANKNEKEDNTKSN